MQQPDSYVFHIVCRDCPLESLVDGELEASRVADSHAEGTKHRVHYEQIA